MGFAVSGATTVASSDTRVLLSATTKDAAVQASATYLVTGLTAGSNTFRAEYRNDTTADLTAATCTFADRSIIVIPY